MQSVDLASRMSSELNFLLRKLDTENAQVFTRVADDVRPIISHRDDRHELGGFADLTTNSVNTCHFELINRSSCCIPGDGPTSDFSRLSSSG
jgi:hypothetical protein